MAIVAEISTVLDVLKSNVAPGALAAAGVFLFASLMFGRHLPAACGAIAWIAGVAVANHFRGAIELPDASARDWLRELHMSLIAKPAWAPRLWLPVLVVAALLAGTVQSRMPRFGWFLLVPIAIVGGRLLADRALGATAVFAVIALANLVVLRRAAEIVADDVVSISAAILLGGAGIIMFLAHSARLADQAMMGAAAFLGLGVAARLTGQIASGAWPALAFGLPGLALIARNDSSSSVPDASFAIASAGPILVAALVSPGIGPLSFLRRPAFVIGASLAIDAVAIAIAAHYDWPYFG